MPSSQKTVAAAVLQTGMGLLYDQRTSQVTLHARHQQQTHVPLRHACSM